MFAQYLINLKNLKANKYIIFFNYGSRKQSPKKCLICNISSSLLIHLIVTVCPIVFFSLAKKKSKKYLKQHIEQAMDLCALL